MAGQVVHCTRGPSQGGELGLRPNYGLFPRMYTCTAAFTQKQWHFNFSNVLYGLEVL